MVEQLPCLAEQIAGARAVVSWASVSVVVAASLAICAAPFLATRAAPSRGSRRGGRRLADALCTALPIAVTAVLLVGALQPAGEAMRAPMALFVQPGAELLPLPSLPAPGGADKTRSGRRPADCAAPRAPASHALKGS